MSKVTSVKRARSADKSRADKALINKLEKEVLKLQEANAQLASDLETLENLDPASQNMFSAMSQDECEDMTGFFDYANNMLEAAQDIAEVAGDPKVSAEYVGNYVRSLLEDEAEGCSECLDDVCKECREKERKEKESKEKVCKA